MRHPTISEDWEPWSDITPGGWCPACNLPSVLSVDWVRSAARRTVRVTRAHQCDDCGHSWLEDLT